METWLWTGIFIVAFLYASVGHGGASGYLALMALFGISPAFIKPSALVLNLFVSGIAFCQFYRKGYFRWNLFLPFAISSIPMAYLGASVDVDPVWYKRILAVCLVLATLRILGLFGDMQSGRKDMPFLSGFVLGGILGFISGMIGIGGGIILSPVILLFRWGDVKETASVSSLFIFVNSLSGLLGQVHTGLNFTASMSWYAAAAVIGGTLGAYAGSSMLNNITVRNSLAVILISASVKLILV